MTPQEAFQWLLLACIVTHWIIIPIIDRIKSKQEELTG